MTKDEFREVLCAALRGALVALDADAPCDHPREMLEPCEVPLSANDMKAQCAACGETLTIPWKEWEEIKDGDYQRQR